VIDVALFPPLAAGGVAILQVLIAFGARSLLMSPLVVVDVPLILVAIHAVLPQNRALSWFDVALGPCETSRRFLAQGPAGRPEHHR